MNKSKSELLTMKFTLFITNFGVIKQQFNVGISVLIFSHLISSRIQMKTVTGFEKRFM